VCSPCLSIWSNDGFAPTCKVRLHQTSYNLAFEPLYLQNGAVDDGRQGERAASHSEFASVASNHKQRGILLVEETYGAHRRAGGDGKSGLRGLPLIGCQEGSPTRQESGELWTLRYIAMLPPTVGHELGIIDR
jgi:hypothetical protein